MFWCFPPPPLSARRRTSRKPRTRIASRAFVTPPIVFRSRGNEIQIRDTVLLVKTEEWNDDRPQPSRRVCILRYCYCADRYRIRRVVKQVHWLLYAPAKFNAQPSSSPSSSSSRPSVSARRVRRKRARQPVDWKNEKSVSRDFRVQERAYCSQCGLPTWRFYGFGGRIPPPPPSAVFLVQNTLYFGWHFGKSVQVLKRIVNVIPPPTNPVSMTNSLIRHWPLLYT